MNVEQLVEFCSEDVTEIETASSATGDSLKESIHAVIAAHLFCPVSVSNVVIFMEDMLSR
jgi:hypothetical protein